MMISFEFIQGMALGVELFFPDEDSSLVFHSVRGFVLHFLLFRIMIMWGFKQNV